MTIGNYLYRLRCGDRAVDLLTASGDGWILANGLGGLQAGQLSVQYEAGAGVLPSLQRIGSTRAPAQITFVAHLTDTSGTGELMRNVHDVQRFVTDTWLHHEEGARAPVYLERRLDEGYSGTGDEVVLFGRGATYYRILAIDSISFPEARHAIINSGWIPDATFTLTCDPYPVGKPQFCAEATGWVDFDTDGNIQLWRGGTNLITNPSFEHATPATNWTAEDANITGTVEYERVRTGWQSMKLVNTHATDAKKYTVSLTLSVLPYAISAYVYTDGSAVTSADCVLYGQGAALTTTFTADADHSGWYRMTALFQGYAASSTHGVQVKGLKVVYVDDVMLEALPVASYGGSDLVTNGGFETAGAGGADIWGTWTETAGDGALADEGTKKYAGSHAAKLTSGATSNTTIAQSITTTAATTYLLAWYQRGDGGGTAGRVQIYDATNAADIVATVATGITAAAYSLCAIMFTTPAGCISVTITHHCPANNTSVSYVDSVSVKALATTSIYPWAPFTLAGYDPHPGVVWAGTEHDSNQTRTAGQFELYNSFSAVRGARTLDPMTGALSIWIKTPWAGNDGLAHQIVNDTGTDKSFITGESIAIYKGNDNTLYFTMTSAGGATKTLSFAVTSAIWPAQTWLCLIATWDTGAPTGLYLYGGTTTSDTSVTTVGDYTAVSVTSDFIPLGGRRSGANLLDQIDGWLGDVRIFGKDAAVTPANLYAAGRGRSVLPFHWTPLYLPYHETGTHPGEQFSNYGFIANLPGDAPAPCRLIINNATEGVDYNRAYFGIRVNGNCATNLNVVEGAQGTDATDGADAVRGNNDRTRVAPANTNEPSAYNVRFTVLADGRKAQLVHGRYKIVAVVRDGAASTGVFKARLKTYLNTTGLMETGEWVSASRVDASEYVLLDMGTFTIPPLDPPQAFLGQTLAQTGDRSAYCNVDMFVWMTSGAGLTFDVDYIILLPEHISGFIYDSANNWGTGNSVVVDAISIPPRTYMTEKSSVGGAVYPHTVTLDPLARVDVQTDWPVLPPGRWCYYNQVLEDASTGVTVDDNYNIWLVQVQPVYLWGA